MRIAALAVVVGVLSTVVARSLIWLIAVITNAVFFQTYSSILTNLEAHTLGLFVIVVPALGGLVTPYERKR